MALPAEKRRFLAGIGLVLAVGFTLAATLAFLVSRASVRSDIAGQSLPLTADNIYSKVQQDLLRPVFIASMMAHDTFVRDWLVDGERETSRINRYLEAIRDNFGMTAPFLVSEASRRYYTSTGILKTVSADDPRDAWYFRVRAMSSIHEINLDPNEDNHDAPTVFVNFRMLGPDGRLLGATGVGLTLASISQAIDRYEGQFQRRICFVDRSGRIILAGRSATHRGDSIRSMSGISRIADAILAGSSSPSSFDYDEGGEHILVNSRYIPELDVFLIVEQSETSATAAILRGLQINLAASLAFSLLALYLVHLLSSRYQRRIEQMADNAIANAARETEIARRQREFVAMVSHEFVTPLAIIDSSLQGLKRDETAMPAEVATRWQRIQRASVRLRELMGNYLADDRMAAGQPPVHEAVDLFVLVRRVAERTEWPDLVIDLPDTPAQVSGDSELLRTLFFNLLNNAVKYSPPGGPIGVSGGLQPGWAIVQVSDRGPGIAADDLPRLFDKYYRGGANRTGGSGLGLYLVRAIATAHGGDVGAESVPGQGSTFTVRLPTAPQVR
jgi:signal transduction histidine kinase